MAKEQGYQEFSGSFISAQLARTPRRGVEEIAPGVPTRGKPIPTSERSPFRQSDGGQRRFCNGGPSFSITGPSGRLSTTRCLPVSLALDMVARFRFRLRIRRWRSLEDFPGARDLKMPLRAHWPRLDTHLPSQALHQDRSGESKAGGKSGCWILSAGSANSLYHCRALQ